MLKLFLWLRYLRKKKIVLLSIAAVALSVALLIVVASLFSGFINAVEKTGQDVLGDIYLYPQVPVPRYGQLLERLESLPEVEAATAILRTYGLLHWVEEMSGRLVFQGLTCIHIQKLAALKNHC